MGCIAAIIGLPLVLVGMVVFGYGFVGGFRHGLDVGSVMCLIIGALMFVPGALLCGYTPKKQVRATRQQMATIRMLRGVVPPGRVMTDKGADFFIDHLRQIRWSCSRCGTPVIDGERLRRTCSRCKAELADCFAHVDEVIR